MITDRYGEYRRLDPARWLICWAHLRRDFRLVAVSNEAHAELGDHLLMLTDKLFDLWDRAKFGEFRRYQFRERLEEQTGVIAQFDQTSITAISSHHRPLLVCRASSRPKNPSSRRFAVWYCGVRSARVRARKAASDTLSG